MSAYDDDDQYYDYSNYSNSTNSTYFSEPLYDPPVSNFKIKELSSSYKLWFSYPYIFATRSCRLLIFQTMNYVRSNSLK